MVREGKSFVKKKVQRALRYYLEKLGQSDLCRQKIILKFAERAMKCGYF